LVSLWDKVTLNVTINKDGLREYAGVLPAPTDGRWVAFMIVRLYLLFGRAFRTWVIIQEWFHPIHVITFPNR
jgi:hypothetical protein